MLSKIIWSLQNWQLVLLSAFQTLSLICQPSAHHAQQKTHCIPFPSSVPWTKIILMPSCEHVNKEIATAENRDNSLEVGGKELQQVRAIYILFANAREVSFFLSWRHFLSLTLHLQVPVAKGANLFPFEVLTGSRTYIFASKSAETTRQWVQVCCIGWLCLILLLTFANKY